VTPEQIEEVGPAFADYLQQYLFCCDYTQTFHLLGVYCRGLLSDLPRKTAEPIALASGTAVRTPQEFLKDHAWSYRRARDTLQEQVAATLARQREHLARQRCVQQLQGCEHLAQQVGGLRVAGGVLLDVGPLARLLPPQELVGQAAD
jgi:hypothetical protein